jgi:imidazolonepropionase-like amidohydrolase
MRAILSTALLSLLLSTGRAQPGPVAFVDVNVIPMNAERVLRRQTVLTNSGRIVALGAAANVVVPRNALRVNAAGKYLMPGLTDMHAHLGRADSATSYPLLLVAHGVTTVRNMYGTPRLLELRRQIDEGAVLGPYIYTTGPIMEGKSGTPVADRMIETIEQAERAVEADKQSGYDAVKVYDLLPADVYDATVRIARKLRVPVFGHVPLSVGLEGALTRRQDSIEHLSGYMQALQDDSSPFKNVRPSRMSPQYVEHVNVDKMRGLAQATRAAGVWNCPTLIIFQNQELTADAAKERMRRPEMKYMHPERLKGYAREIEVASSRIKADDRPLYERADQLRKRMVKMLHDAGARLLLGTDFPPSLTIPGYSVHEELRNFVSAGLSPYQALEVATHDAAEFLGKPKEFGVIALGSRADLLLLDGNPLTDIGNASKLVGVMVRGRWLTKQDLQQRLDDVAASFAGQ